MILGLGNPGAWPVTVPPRPLPPEEDEEVEEALPVTPAPARGWNAGRPVFRVRVSHALARACLGAVLALVASVPVIMIWRPAASLILLGISLGAAIGFFYGAAHAHDVCSDPACDEVIPPAAPLCPRCAGRVAGSIRSRNDRLAAEEDLEEQSGKTGDGGGAGG